MPYKVKSDNTVFERIGLSTHDPGGRKKAEPMIVFRYIHEPTRFDTKSGKELMLTQGQFDEMIRKEIIFEIK